MTRCSFNWSKTHPIYKSYRKITQLLTKDYSTYCEWQPTTLRYLKKEYLNAYRTNFSYSKRRLLFYRSRSRTIPLLLTIKLIWLIREWSKATIWYCKFRNLKNQIERAWNIKPKSSNKSEKIFRRTSKRWLLLLRKTRKIAGRRWRELKSNWPSTVWKCKAFKSNSTAPNNMWQVKKV